MKHIREGFQSRHLFIAIAVVDMLFIGTSYSWSLFVVPMETALGWPRATLTAAYTIRLWFYCGGSMFSGIWNRNHDYRRMVLFTAMLYGLAYGMLYFLKTPAWLYLFYSAIGGFANGALYNTLLNAVHKFVGKGLQTLTGVLLMAIGFSNMALGPLITTGIATLGWRTVFAIMGISMFLIFGASALLYPRPARETVIAIGAPMKISESLADLFGNATFWIFFVWSTLFYLIGQACAAFTGACGTDIGASAMQATWMVGIFSLCNGVGRLLFGRLYDMEKVNAVMRAVCLVHLLGTACMALSIYRPNIALMFAGNAFLGLGYGALMITNPIVMRGYGERNYSLNLSVIMLNGIPASTLSAMAMNISSGRTGSYMAAFSLFFVLSAVNFALTFGMKSIRVL